MDPNHLDDSHLSGALDGELDAAGAAHLGACPECARRRDRLAGARHALAGVAVEPLDELTRRRILAAALAAAPAGVGKRPWYQRPATAGAVAAALLVVFAAVPFLAGTRDSGDTAASPAAEMLAAGQFLGDLGDISDPASVRSRIAGDTRVTADTAEPGTDVSAAPAAPPVAASEPEASVTRPAEGAPEDGYTLRSASPLVRDAAGEEPGQCVDVLSRGPARGAPLAAVGTGTWRGLPAVVAVFDETPGPMVYVAARDDCRVLDGYRL